jgi:hypothetical protein
MARYFMKIAVIFPSRGLAFSQTCEELLENLEGYDYDIFFAHGLSIPNCFNKPLGRALESHKRYTHFWFVEDDMVLPKNTLKRLLAEGVPAIMCDYPMDAKGKPAILRDPDSYAIYGGTGCLLVTRKFIQSFKKPVFHSDIAWDIRIGETVEVKSREVKDEVYGLHDVNFSLEAYQRGIPIKVSKVRCGHRKLKELGQSGSNVGYHEWEVWTDLKPNILPKVKSSIVPVELDGQIINVPATSKLAKNYKPRYVEFS